MSRVPATPLVAVDYLLLIGIFSVNEEIQSAQQIQVMLSFCQHKFEFELFRN
jgi:hypothetical protein